MLCAVCVTNWLATCKALWIASKKATLLVRQTCQAVFPTYSQLCADLQGARHDSADPEVQGAAESEAA